MNDLIVSAAQVLVTAEEPTVQNNAVLVRDGIITGIGPVADLERRSPAAQRYDFAGATILPGLINAHVHLAFDVSRDPVPALEEGEPGTLRRTIESNARDLLDGGVTTARDLGDRDGLVAGFRRDVDSGGATGPHMLTSLAPLTPPKGHCWFLGGEVDGIEAIRSRIADHADRGADWIKVMAGGGRMTPSAAPVWESQFGPREMEAVIEAAREAGLPVAAHAHGTGTMQMCADVGVQTIEHGSWISGPTTDPRCYDVRDEVADAIAASGASLVHTRGRKWSAWSAEELDMQLERLAWIRGRGVQLTPGTDAGVGKGYFDDLVEHLTLYRAAGWSNTEALMMATTHSAQTLGVANRTGRLQEGLDADLLVVAKDPRVDLEALRTVRCVFAKGRPHFPKPTRGR